MPCPLGLMEQNHLSFKAKIFYENVVGLESMATYQLNHRDQLG